MKRRQFLKKVLLAGASFSAPHIWLKKSLADEGLFKITLLQTNDTHSRIDPFPLDGGKYQGMGGIARRSSIIKKIRQGNPNTLLVDAGDTLQGTPYFNLYGGRVEFETMTECGYDVSTLGNHEFDNGVNALANILQYAKFDMVNCNYTLNSTPLSSLIKLYTVKEVEHITVGITGVGIDFVDLVARKNHQGVTYLAPFQELQSVVDHLRHQLGCQLVVVLSHLGYQYDDDKIPSDIQLANRVSGIDWIVGGHTHTFIERPVRVKSVSGHSTHILQVGWAGIILGKTDFYFRNDHLVNVDSNRIPVNENSGLYWNA
jgi:5'-nucleotidase